MPRKKKSKVNPYSLNFKPILEEAVACCRLGRQIASFGATLTGREKNNANLVYVMLNAGRDLPDRTPTTARIREETKSKKYSPTDAIKWFARKYPKEAEPLLARLKSTYDSPLTSVVYGVQHGKDLSNENYIAVLRDILDIPEQDAAVMFHGSIKPQFDKMTEEEGLVSLAIK